jgi:hypothetical protein
MINLTTFQLIIDKYKSNFKEINNAEIYKWTAIKQFQDHWNSNAIDFKKMLLDSLARTSELMDSGNYFPKRMLTHYLNKDPEKVKELFLHLYDDGIDLKDRIVKFREGMAMLQASHSSDRNHYQDPRAIMVYLTLKYPEQYFLYKFKMFKTFASLIGYPYSINRRQLDENVFLYLSLCQVVHQHVLADNELIKMHHSRLGAEHYADINYHLLTQDIIYAATKYFTDIKPQYVSFKIIEVTNQAIQPSDYEPSLQARQTNFMEKAIVQKWIGDLGEQAVLDYERGKLRQAGIFDKEPIPIAKIKGDGLGYDIDSYDSDGTPIFIEVKTTKSLNSPFYITNAELLKSKQEGNRYRLYRLFNFDEKARIGELIIYKGSLEMLCIHPVAYYVPYQLVTI